MPILTHLNNPFGTNPIIQHHLLDLEGKPKLLYSVWGVTQKNNVAS
jgi:hypothetical protein